jgi:hypothetical protein
MIRAFALIACLISAAAFAQSNTEPPADMGAASGMMHGQHMMMQGQHGMPGAGMVHRLQEGGAFATQPGQGAFAAIQEIVQILVADPETDWSKVDIDALRQHLVDMNNVTLSANVKSESIDGGMRFDVTGEGPVRDSIRRMTMAHAATMNGVEGWRFEAAEIEGGASLTVHPPAKDAKKLRGLGFFGVLTLGMHHQMHHLLIARGENPHG